MSDSRLIPGTSRSYEQLERDLGELYQSVLPYRFVSGGNSELFKSSFEILKAFSDAYGVISPDNQVRDSFLSYLSCKDMYSKATGLCAYISEEAGVPVKDLKMAKDTLAWLLLDDFEKRGVATIHDKEIEWGDKSSHTLGFLLF